MSVFGRLSKVLTKNNIKKYAGIYGPMIQKALKSDLATALLGDRAKAINSIIGKGMAMAQLL